jgi:2-polyprenyl-3-methyl-5-hydroxy-6-metoxy-1,4-benzoquinol methylase
MANTDMAEYWNGRPGDVWATEAERFDSVLAPFGRRLLTAAHLKSGERVLDVGCGNGAISLDAARGVGRHGRVTGLDLSAPMLDVARQRAEEQGLDVSFVQDDAQTASFDEPFDVVLSRFGVMFFDDPEAAFANFAKATRGSRYLPWQWWPMSESPSCPRLAPPDPSP